MRVPEAEALVEKQGAAAFREAGRIAADTVTPIDDVRASARYRKLLVATLVERALAACADRIAQGWLMTRQALDLTINGESHQLMVEPHWSLLHVLRRELGMTGTKENCLEAECGVCTVLLDGKAVNSCILLAEQARGRSIVTIEGLGDPEHLHPLQAAFIEHGAVQCGYCIPGMILTRQVLPRRTPRPRAERGRGARGAVRHAVPLHRLPEDRRRGDRGGAPDEFVARAGEEGVMSTYERRVAGKRLKRIDGVGKVTGKHVYASDFALPGMLFGKVLRSSEAHARIVRLDVTRALALPGVRTILTATDIPQILFGTAIKDRPVFAADVVRFRGEAIAAVAATSLEIAEAAVRAIEIEYEPLPRGVRHGGGADARRAAGPCRLERLPGAAGVRPRGQRLRPLLDGRRRRRGGLRAVPIASTSIASRRSTCTRATPSRAPRSRAGTATATSASGATPSFPST